MTETVTVTDEVLEASRSAEQFTIELSTHKFTFLGWHLASASTKKDWSVRWTSMDLYRIANPKTTAKYLLLINGRSVVYHVLDQECSSGEYREFGTLPSDAKPCPKCARRARPIDETPVLYETDIPSVYECVDAVGVVTSLLANNRNGGKQVASGPAEDLLWDAAEFDPAFAPNNVEIKL